MLEKKLFIATKKKTERTMIIEQPIGTLQEISKGIVGLVAWTGVYLRFRPERRLDEIPFDVKDREADRDIAAIKGYNSERGANHTSCLLPPLWSALRKENLQGTDLCAVRILRYAIK